MEIFLIRLMFKGFGKDMNEVFKINKITAKFNNNMCNRLVLKSLSLIVTI